MTDGEVMRNLPSEVRIGGKTFALHRSHTTSGNGNWGETDHFNHEMRFSPDCHPKQMANTFWHEVLHAAWNMYGLKDLTDNEERIVTALANGIVQVAQDLGLFPEKLWLAGEVPDG